jgi:hypothetical protein
MVIKQRNQSLWDVFIGDGWDNFLSVRLNHKERKAEVFFAEPHVDATPKLLELIYFKIKKQIANERKQNG